MQKYNPLYMSAEWSQERINAYVVVVFIFNMSPEKLKPVTIGKLKYDKLVDCSKIIDSSIMQLQLPKR